MAQRVGTVSLSIRHSSKQITLQLDSRGTVGDLITKTSASLGIPRDQLNLIWAGVRLSDENCLLSGFSLTSETIIHAIQATVTSEQAQSSWKRPNYIPLPEVTPPVLNLEGAVEKTPVFIWCDKSIHKSLTNKVDKNLFPHQVQAASVRFQCGVCHQEGIEFDSSLVQKWTDLLMSPSPLTCFCFFCEEEQIFPYQ